MLSCTGKRSHRHTILHVSFSNSFGLASARPTPQGLSGAPRKGLGLGGGPWFVVKKDIEKNIVFVSHGYDTRQQYGRQFLLTDFHFLTADPWNGAPLADILFKIRHTEPPVAGTLCQQADGRFLIRSSQEIQGIAPGQFGVLYTQDGTICAGSGEITV